MKTDPHGGWQLTHWPAVGAPAVSALSEALQHAEDAVRIEASYALAQVGDPAAVPAIPALMERTKDECVEVRRYLAEVLWRDLAQPPRLQCLHLIDIVGETMTTNTYAL